MRSDEISVICNTFGSGGDGARCRYFDPGKAEPRIDKSGSPRGRLRATCGCGGLVDDATMDIEATTTLSGLWHLSCINPSCACVCLHLSLATTKTHAHDSCD